MFWTMRSIREPITKSVEKSLTRRNPLIARYSDNGPGGLCGIGPHFLLLKYFSVLQASEPQHAGLYDRAR
jgi:hypothetical protein